MAEIFISRETAQDINVFYGDKSRTFLEGKFQKLGINVERVTVRDLLPEDILNPGVIRTSDGEKFRLEGFSVAPGVIDFELKKEV